jgi:hypothetical protein
VLKEISKKLSLNDLGLTGSHQAGILVPKEPTILNFFPTLNSSNKNPRVTLTVREKDDSSRWEFNYIYYNNKKFGGTRNEYRLTCMTKYLRAVSAKENDEIVFQSDENGSIFVHCKRADSKSYHLKDDGVLVLGNGWKVINT